MRTVSVGELKTNFSEILKDVVKGEKIIITFGKKSRKMAVIIPFNEFFGKKRKLGLLAKKGKVRFSKDWSMTEEEFVKG
jgi:prevent-host-death family protein